MGYAYLILVLKYRKGHLGMPIAETRCLKVALISPPPASQWAFVDYQYPLIGLAYVAAVLEKDGHQVMVIDCPPQHLTYKRIDQEISHFQPDIIGITSVMPLLHNNYKVAQNTKQVCPRGTRCFGWTTRYNHR